MTHKRRARGYTAVELLMSIAILTVGVTGVVAMQKVTVTSNQHAKNLAIATQVGQAWMEQLRADAVAWNHPSAQQPASDLVTDTTWLQAVPTGNTAPWFQPAWSQTRSFGAGFDAQGRPVNPASGTPVRFCTHLRLSWLYRSDGTMAGDGLIRAETRVFWLREGQGGLAGQPVCSPTEVPANIGAETSRYHFVYNVSAVRQNTLF